MVPVHAKFHIVDDIQISAPNGVHSFFYLVSLANSLKLFQPEKKISYTSDKNLVRSQEILMNSA